MHDRNLRRYICAFRISAHRLRIEHGRYCGEKPEDRLCDSCKVIENEIHFLWQCKKYDTLRLKMFDRINDSNLVPSIDYKDTFTCISLMASTDKCINKVVANFIHDCQITKNIIYIHVLELQTIYQSYCIICHKCGRVRVCVNVYVCL